MSIAADKMIIAACGSMLRTPVAGTRRRCTAGMLTREAAIVQPALARTTWPHSLPCAANCRPLATRVRPSPPSPHTEYAGPKRQGRQPRRGQ